MALTTASPTAVGLPIPLRQPSEGFVGEKRGLLGGWLGFPGLLLIPALVIIAVFLLYPALSAFLVALQSWSGFSPKSHFVGLGNFAQLLSDEIFRSAMANSLLWMLVGGAGHFFFATILAVAIQDPRLRARKFFQTLIIFPMFISAIGIATLWKELYDPREGLINQLLCVFSLANPSQGTPGWLNPSHGIYPLLVVSIWGSVGSQVILILAGLRQIPLDLYEAARVDGANEWQCFWRISLPLMRGILKIAMVLWIIESLQMFGLIQGMLGPDVEPRLHVISTYMFDMAFSNRSNIYHMGQATAMAVVLVIVTIFLVAFLLGVYRLIFGKEKLEF